METTGIKLWHRVVAMLCVIALLITIYPYGIMDAFADVTSPSADDIATWFTITETSYDADNDIITGDWAHHKTVTTTLNDGYALPAVGDITVTMTSSVTGALDPSGTWTGTLNASVTTWTTDSILKNTTITTVTSNALGEVTTDRVITGIDSTGPVIAFSAESYVNTANGVSITGTVTDADESGVKTLLVGGATVTVNADGSFIHNVSTGVDGDFKFIATDNVGNTSEKTVTVTLPDTTAPEIQSVVFKTADAETYTDDTWTNQVVTATITATDEDAYDADTTTGCQYSFDDGATWQDSNTKIYGEDDQATSHTVVVKVKDAAENVTTYSGSFTVKVDKLKPTLTVSAHSDDLTHDEVSISGTVEDTSGKPTLTVLSDAEGAESEEVTLTQTGISNEYTFTFEASKNANYTFTATDVAGNTDIKLATVNTIDTEKPVVQATATHGASSASYTSGDWTNEEVTITVLNTTSANLGTTAYYFTKDDTIKDVAGTSGWTTISKTGEVYTFTSAATPNDETPVTYYIKAVSASGVESDVVEFVVKIDLKAPEKESVTGNITDTEKWAQEIALTIPAVDNGSGVASVWVQKGDGDYTEVSDTADSYIYTVTENGTYTFKVIDLQDNEVELDAITVTQIDRTAPSIEYSFDKTEDDNVYGGTHVATLTVTEESQFSLDGSTVSIQIKEGATSYSSLSDYLDSYTGSDKASYSTTWSDKGSDTYTIEIPFTGDDTYEITVISCKDDAGNLAEAITVPSFTMDNTAPTASVKAGTWQDTFESLLNAITFGLYAKSDVTVTVTPTDDNGFESVGYYTATEAVAETITAETIKNPDITWETVTGATSGAPSDVTTLTGDQRTVVYVRVIDKAGNATYVSTDGLVIDTLLDNGETIKFAVNGGADLSADSDNYKETKDSSYYNEDVEVKVTVEDPSVGGSYIGSWLKTVEYQVYNGTTQTNGTSSDEWTNLYTESDLQAYQYEGTVTIPIATNYSNDVKLVVRVTDNAGNEYTETLFLQMDNTKPEVEIAYDNDISGNDIYFDTRTATITVDELNFDETEFTATVKHTADDGTVITTTIDEAWIAQNSLSWVTTGTKNILTIDFGANGQFAEDGDYEVTVTNCTDLAKNAMSAVTFDDDVNNAAFVIDTTAPVIALSYGNDVYTDTNKGYFQSRTAIITVTEHNFDEAGFVATLTTDSGTPVSICPAEGNSYEWVEGENNTHTLTIPFTADADYKVDITSYTDLAGKVANSVAYDAGEDSTNTNTFTIDSTAASVLVLYTNNDAQNDMYFDAARSATFHVEEHNFMAGTFTATIKQTDADGTETKVTLDTSNFTETASNSGIWECTYAFPVGAQYEITNVIYTDRAGLETTVTADDCKQKDAQTTLAVAPFEFYVDETAPTAKISANGLNDPGAEPTFWEQLVDTITFGLFANTKVEVTITAEDELSKEPTISYFMQTSETQYTAAEDLKALEESTWTAYTGVLSIEQNERVVVYARVIDKAGNTTYLSSAGMVYDDLLKDQAAIEFTTTHSTDNTVWSANVEESDGVYTNADRKLYNDDVTVQVVVTDPSVTYDSSTTTYVGAGLKAISYTITNNDTNATTTYKLTATDFAGFTLVGPTAQELNDARTHSFDIVVDKTTYNSNDVEVLVEIEDNAGNTYSETLSLMIDSTAPTAAITDVTAGTYYNADTTAKVTVTERNFDAKNTSVTVTRVDDDGVNTAAVYTADETGTMVAAQYGDTTLMAEESISFGTWSEATGSDSNGDGTTNAINVTFEADGDYTIAVNTTDKASNAMASEVKVEKFSIDQTQATMTITGLGTTANEYKNVDSAATITVVERDFVAENTTIAITRKDDADAETTATYTVNAGGTYTTETGATLDTNAVVFGTWSSSGTGKDTTNTITVTFKLDGDYTIAVNTTDEAGNSPSEVKTANAFTIDQTIPVIQAIAGVGTTADEYYNADPKATVTVTEHNFDEANTTITIQRVDDDDKTTKSTYTIEGETVKSEGTNLLEDDDVSFTQWTSSNNENTIDVTFKVDGDYTITVNTTDKASNDATGVSTVNAFTVDKTKAKVEIEYDNNTAVNDTYFSKERVATITVTEHNFDIAKFEATVKATDNASVETELSYDSTTIGTADSIWSAWSTSGNVHTITVIFKEDADYDFDAITIEDVAGNSTTDEEVTYEANTVCANLFTVDNIDPVMTIAFNNDAVQNGEYFKSARTATVTIEEHNFFDALYAHGIEVTVTAKNLALEDVMDTTDSSKTVEEVLEALLEDQSQWTQTSTNVWQAEIPFTVDANYTFDITYTDLVDRKTPAVDAAGYDAIFGESNAPNEFTIDTIVPTANITVTSTKAYEVVSGTLASALEKVWDFDEEATDVVNKALDTITFGWWSSQAVTVKLESEDELSGVYQLSHFRAANKVDDLTNYTSWTTLGDEVTTTEYTVDQDEQFIVYMSVVDKAGNKLYISSNGLMVDMTETGVDTVNPEINVTPVNELYNEDFNIQVEINDPMVKVTDINNDEVDVYSGLASLTYELTNNDTGEVTQQGTLKDFVRPESETGTVPAMQSYTNDAAITILAEEKNNSNNLELVITATDNAGNVTTTEPLKLSMDITAPEITVSYDNNEDDADFPGYFKEDRTATITVIERNFDAENTEITLENTDGTVIPSTTTWVETTGTGNGDNTKNVATITYNEDGKYEFDIVTTDLAGNEMKNEVDYGDSVEPTEFCIDKTIPEITITYDNNEALNENYYDAVRTATVTITEHNFDASRVELDLVASDNGATVPAPTLSAWTKVGDENIATIAYTADAFYVFDLNFIDMAGNQAEDIDEQQFYVDTTVPELEITGVADLTANNGEVIPIVTYSDTNFNEDTVTITLLGAMRQVVALDGAYANIANGQTFTFNDFGYEKEIDDIYTLNAEVQDMAGNVSTQTITFSVNRFGSTYMFSDATKNLVNTFSNEEHEIVVTEINTDKLTDIILTLFKNDEEIVLIENEDYTITLTGGNGQWYSYEYTIFADNFEDDGVYNLHIHSQDAAGNIAENTFDTKNMDISFGIDKTAPNVIIINLEEGVTYAQELLTVLMTVNDNMKLVHGVVYLDGVEHVSWSEEEITEMVKNSEDFIFDIDDSSISAHEVVVVFTDVAGNETSLTVSDFYVTTNLFVRYYNNKVLFYGSISGAVLLSSAGLYFAMKKKGIKISEEETV